MAGINQGRPELAVGEPIRLGNNDEFEIEQHPVSDRLIIRDTQNGKVAYIRGDSSGQIGGDGVLIKALKEGNPMADTGKTYSSITNAINAASSWVFIPPGNFTDTVMNIETTGLTIVGSGNATKLSSGSGDNMAVNAPNVTIKNLEMNVSVHGIQSYANNTTIDNIHFTGTPSGNVTQISGADNMTVTNCKFEHGGDSAFESDGSGHIFANNIVNGGAWVVMLNGSTRDSIVANNILHDGNRHIRALGDNCIIIGNRVYNSSATGVEMQGADNIAANNRTDLLSDNGSGNLLDANLTGASN